MVQMGRCLKRMIVQTDRRMNIKSLLCFFHLQICRAASLERSNPETCYLPRVSILLPRGPTRILLGSLPYATPKTDCRCTWNLMWFSLVHIPKLCCGHAGTFTTATWKLTAGIPTNTLRGSGETGCMDSWKHVAGTLKTPCKVPLFSKTFTRIPWEALQGPPETRYVTPKRVVENPEISYGLSYCNQRRNEKIYTRRQLKFTFLKPLESPDEAFLERKKG